MISFIEGILTLIMQPIWERQSAKAFKERNSKFRAHLLSEYTRDKHNDYDFACNFWWGDRSVDRPIIAVHREMDGSPVTAVNQRCLVCNPYPEETS